MSFIRKTETKSRNSHCMNIDHSFGSDACGWRHVQIFHIDESLRLILLLYLKEKNIVYHCIYKINQLTTITTNT